jgi:hypothetical protein
MKRGGKTSFNTLFRVEGGGGGGGGGKLRPNVASLRQITVAFGEEGRYLRPVPNLYPIEGSAQQDPHPCAEILKLAHFLPKTFRICTR